MFQFIKNKLQEFIKIREKQKQEEEIWGNNFSSNQYFLKKVPIEKIEKFFHYLVKNYASDIVTIEYSTTKKNIKELNKFYNQFFSKYEKIIISDDETVVDFLYVKEDIIEKSFKDLIIIGQDGYSEIFIKSNSKKNGIYINGLDTEEDINRETPLFENIFYLLITSIFANKAMLIEDIYNEMINNEK